jgi:predicted component of type VI protein secretion system
MSTDDRELRSLLAELHQRLHDAKTVDPDARDLLATVADDIEDALERSGTRPIKAETKLEELAVKFELDHPALAEAVRDVVDALGKAGI